MLVEGARVGDLLDLALMEHRDTVGHGQGFALVVGDIDHGHAQALVQVLDLHLHMLAQLLVQGAQGLVHQHQLWLEDQGAGQGHTLLLAAGKLARITVAEAVQLDHGQRLLHPLGAVGARQAAHAEGEGQVLGHGHMGEQGIVLEHHANVALVRRQAVEGAPVEKNLAGGRGLETGQHHQAGGLARTGRAQQGKELTLADIQIEILDDQILAVIALLHATKADQYIVCLRPTHRHTFCCCLHADGTRLGGLCGRQNRAG